MAGLFQTYAGGSLTAVYNDSYSPTAIPPGIFDLRCHLPVSSLSTSGLIQDEVENCETGTSFINRFGLNGCRYQPEYWTRYYSASGVPDYIEDKNKCSLPQAEKKTDLGSEPTELAGCFTGGVDEDLCTNALHTWGSQMCEREHKQFMKPYCEGGNVKIGLFGSDSECKQLVASKEVGVSRKTEIENCFYHDFFNYTFGPWKFRHTQAEKPQWMYSVKCDQFDQPTLQYHFPECNFPLFIFTNWPIDLCMDTRDAACADWDPGFAHRPPRMAPPPPARPPDSLILDSSIPLPPSTSGAESMFEVWVWRALFLLISMVGIWIHGG